MNGPLKLLVVGTSFGKNYLEHAKSSKNYEIGGVVARTDESITAAGEKYGIDPRRRFTDLHIALEKLSDIDVVAITVPNQLHYKFAKKVLKSGKHLILEKPMVETWEQAVELIHLLDRTDNKNRKIKSMVGQTLRGEMMIRFMAHYINKENLVGNIEQMTFESHWNWVGDPEKEWRFSLEDMWMEDIGIHQFDEIRMLLGDRKCTHVLAQSYRPPSYPIKESNPTYSAILQFEDNIHLNYFGSQSTHGANIGWYGRTHVFGDKGCLMRDAVGQPYFYSRENPDEKIGLDDIYGDLVDEKLDLVEYGRIPYLMEDFYLAIQEDRAPVTDLHDNLNTFAIILAIKLSAKENRKVDVQKEFPLP